MDNINKGFAVEHALILNGSDARNDLVERRDLAIDGGVDRSDRGSQRVGGREECSACRVDGRVRIDNLGVQRDLCLQRGCSLASEEGGIWRCTRI